MVPDGNDTVNSSILEKKNTSFICGVVEGTFYLFFLKLDKPVAHIIYDSSVK